eukprot:SAG22_NODE_1938_length_3288_cov_2.551270_3_plen_326_part_00
MTVPKAWLRCAGLAAALLVLVLTQVQDIFIGNGGRQMMSESPAATAPAVPHTRQLGICPGSLTPPNIIQLAEEELRALDNAKRSHTATDPDLERLVKGTWPAPCSGIVGAGIFAGKSCAAAWCCVAAESDVRAANQWCEHLILFGCFLDPSLSINMTQCPDRCERIDDLTERDPTRNKQKILHRLQAEQMSRDKAVGITNYLVRETMIAPGPQPRKKMQGVQGADPCHGGRWRWIVEDDLISAEQLSACKNGEPAVTIDQVVFGIPTLDRGGQTFEQAYLPVVVDSMLEYVDPGSIYLMKAGDKANPHPVSRCCTLPGCVLSRWT